MWTKVYLATLIVFVFLLGSVLFYAASWLGSITVPADAFAGYEYYRSTSWWMLWIASAVLVILANILMARTGRAWAFWATFGFFSIFVLIVGFVLPLSAIGFLRENGFSPELSQYLSPFFAVAMCVAFGAAMYANQFIATRMRRGLIAAGDPYAETIDDEDAARSASADADNGHENDKA